MQDSASNPGTVAACRRYLPGLRSLKQPCERRRQLIGLVGLFLVRKRIETVEVRDFASGADKQFLARRGWPRCGLRIAKTTIPRIILWRVSVTRNALHFSRVGHFCADRGTDGRAQEVQAVLLKDSVPVLADALRIVGRMRYLGMPAPWRSQARPVRQR
jgi:hypothetical protein